jgi:chromosome segregation ATPase
MNNAIRSTQEQLRQDHIGTLEVLQQCKDENIRLRKELKDLKKGIGQAEQTSMGSGDVTGDYDVAQLVEQNTKQAEEIKMLKTRMNQTEVELLKLRGSTVSAQHAAGYAASEKQKKRELEVTSALMDVEHSLRATQVELRASTDRCLYLEEQLTRLSNARNEASADLESKVKMIEILRVEGDAARLEIRRLQAEAAIFAAERDKNNASSVIKLARLQDELELCKVETEKAKKQCAAQDEVIARLEADRIELAAQMKSKEMSTQALQTALLALKLERGAIQEESTVVYGDSDTESGQRETFQLTESAPVCKSPLRPSTVSSSTSRSAPDSPEGGDGTSFRFQEFLRLKRENKELKMRLADMGHGAAASNSIASAIPTSRSSGSLAPLVSPRLHSAAGSMRRPSPKTADGGPSASSRGGVAATKKFF